MAAAPNLLLSSAVQKFTNRVTEVLDKYAPMKTRSVKIMVDAPWFDGEYERLRKMRRKAEKKFKKSGLFTDKENYNLYTSYILILHQHCSLHATVLVILGSLLSLNMICFFSTVHSHQDIGLDEMLLML